MPQLTVLGHPVHPILISFPIGSLAFTSAMDTMHVATKRKSYATSAKNGLVFGLVGLAAAAATGLADYLTIPARSPEKKVANLHALINVAVSGSYAASLAARLRGGPGDRRGIAWAGLGLAAMMVSGWYGGHLVYEHGVRVKGQSITKRAHTLKAPGDDKLAHALSMLAERAMPGAGPVTI